MADQLRAEITVLDDALRAYEVDIAKLQHRLREARSRQTQIAARLESAENRFKLRSLMTNERVDDALTRFDQLERRVDYAEGRADALSISEGGKKSLADEFAATAGTAVLVMIIIGGVLYTVGGVVYGLKRPNPFPQWFGFHEVFHSFTIFAFIAHYVGVSMATYSLR